MRVKYHENQRIVFHDGDSYPEIGTGPVCTLWAAGEKVGRVAFLRSIYVGADKYVLFKYDMDKDTAFYRKVTFDPKIDKVDKEKESESRCESIPCTNPTESD